MRIASQKQFTVLNFCACESTIPLPEQLESRAEKLKSRGRATETEKKLKLVEAGRGWWRLVEAGRGWSRLVEFLNNDFWSPKDNW